MSAACLAEHPYPSPTFEAKERRIAWENADGNCKRTGTRGHVYISPDQSQSAIANSTRADDIPSGSISHWPGRTNVVEYGLDTFADLFTDRQSVALTTFSDLVSETRERVRSQALAAQMTADGLPLANGGMGADAYADAIATYLGIAVRRAADAWSSITSWRNGVKATRGTFVRQALPMVWDFAEANPFSTQCGNWIDACVEWVAKFVGTSMTSGSRVTVIQQDAAGRTPLVDGAVVATDPPYYDNIGYADLSDFFYVWHRRSLRTSWPDLFRRLLVPKEEELVASPYRHGGRDSAEQFFMTGMGRPVSCIKLHRILRTLTIPRHRLVRRIPNPSRCAQRHETRLSRVCVFLIRVRRTHTRRCTRRALH